jgi:hypothetical protein
MASGHVNRIKRPDTWLHRPMLQNVKKVLANPEPSTHGTKRTSGDVCNLVDPSSNYIFPGFAFSPNSTSRRIVGAFGMGHVPHLAPAHPLALGADRKPSV